MNVKALLILCLFLVLSVGVSRANVAGSTFFLHVGNGGGVAFHVFTLDENGYVSVDVTSGAFNSSTATLSMDTNHGQLRFQNNESVTFTTTFANVSRLQVNNVFAESGVSTSGSQDDVIIIEWWITVEPWLPITFIFGMIGLGCMFVAPLYAIHLFKKKEYRWALVQFVSIGAMGVGLVLAWLWGGA